MARKWTRSNDSGDIAWNLDETESKIAILGLLIAESGLHSYCGWRDGMRKHFIQSGKAATNQALDRINATLPKYGAAPMRLAIDGDGFGYADPVSQMAERLAWEANCERMDTAQRVREYSKLVDAYAAQRIKNGVETAPVVPPTAARDTATVLRSTSLGVGPSGRPLRPTSYEDDEDLTKAPGVGTLLTRPILTVAPGQGSVLVAKTARSEPERIERAAVLPERFAGALSGFLNERPVRVEPPCSVEPTQQPFAAPPLRPAPTGPERSYVGQRFAQDPADLPQPTYARTHPAHRSDLSPETVGVIIEDRPRLDPDTIRALVRMSPSEDVAAWLRAYLPKS